MKYSAGAFVPGVEVRIAGRPGGPLAGLAFAAKDLFDVAGVPTGGGNPDWLRVNPVPVRHAALVDRLLASGAALEGKTITDEVSLGILGENAFYGTPRNAAAPGHVPGGSSSGSAAAVAAGLVDFALGSDTGGSVRVPASFCGLHGLRPTHGRLELAGMMAQAPSFDTAGWFARDAGREAVGGAHAPGSAGPPAAPARTGRGPLPPTTPFPAPRTGLPLSRQNEIGLQIAALTCVAGLSGLPQLSVPGATVEGRPDGFDEIHAHRVRRPAGPGIKEQRIRLEILTLGRDFATVNLEFKVRGRDLVGRQSQTWVRFPDVGWKVVSAHVSTVNEAPLW